MRGTEVGETAAKVTNDEADKSGSEEGKEELSRDDIFHFLQCRRRRLILKYLQEYTGDEPAVMSDIAEHIAALENDTTVRALDSQQRQRVYIALYQSHLPKMDRADIIDYNQDRGYVESTDFTSEFLQYLDDEPSVLADNGPSVPVDDGPSVPVEGETQSKANSQDQPPEQGSRWQQRYFAAALVSAVGAGVMAITGSSLAVPSAANVALITSTLFGLLGLVHTQTPAVDT